MRSHIPRNNSITRALSRQSALPQWLPEVQSWLTLATTTFDLFLRLSPLFLVISGVSILNFLRQLGWTDLFQDAALSGTGLLFFLSASVGLFVFMWLLVVAPSVMIIGFSSLTDSTKRSPEPLVGMYLAAGLGWLFFYCISWFSYFSFLTAFALTFIPGFVFGLIKVDQWRGVFQAKSEVNSSAESRGMATDFWISLKVAGVAIAATVSAMFSSFPLLALLGLWRFANHEQREWLGIAAAFVMFVSLIPGLFYLKGRTSRDGFSYALKVGAAVHLVVAILFSLFTMAYTPWTLFCLDAVAISENKPTMHQVLSPSLVTALKSAGFEVLDGEAVVSYTRFRLGDVMLLCKHPMSRFAYGTKEFESSSPGAPCVKALRSEVRPIRKIAGEVRK